MSQVRILPGLPTFAPPKVGARKPFQREYVRDRVFFIFVARLEQLPVG
jgi:hypothetical protein